MLLLWVIIHDHKYDGSSFPLPSSGVLSSGVRVQSHRGSGSHQGCPGGQQVWPLVKRSKSFPLVSDDHSQRQPKKQPTKQTKAEKHWLFMLLPHHFRKCLSPSVNSDGEETNTADNSDEIYYSLNYEADLLFTRFDSFSKEHVANK